MNLETEEKPMLDLLFLVIGVAGFVALWAITKACDRV
jgi:hypothetical protein